MVSVSNHVNPSALLRASRFASFDGLRMIFVASSFVLSGCVVATRQDMVRLSKDINGLRANQADLVNKLDKLSENMRVLGSQLETSQSRMSTLSQKLDDVQADLARRMSVLSGQVTGTSTPGPPTPSDVYRLAYNDFTAGKYDLALVGFRNYLSQFPKGELVSRVKFNMGECHFARRSWAEAAAAYEKVVEDHPKSEVAPAALYKKALALQEAKKRSEAKRALEVLLQQYPHADEAASAKDLLKEIAQ